VFEYVTEQSVISDIPVPGNNLCVPEQMSTRRRLW